MSNATVSSMSPVVGLLMAAAFAAPANSQSIAFTDQTAAAGLTSIHSFDETSPPQVMSAGGACGDFNNDGWQDLFVLQGLGSTGARDRLFINNRDGTFSEQGLAWGVGITRRGLGVAVGDYDRDGWLDLMVTVEPGVAGGGYTFNSLYRNNGNGTFTDVAFAAGVAHGPPTSAYGGGWGAAFGDYDLDGHLDLAIGDWLEPAAGNLLYRNTGSGTFVDVTSATIGTALNASQGFSPRMVDMDGDRYPELLWTSDFGGSKYLVNAQGQSFSNQTSLAGVGLDGNGMGTSIGDFNGDGRPDWFVTSIYTLDSQPNQPGTGNMLYMNLGNNRYSEVSAAAGVKQGGWGWGSVAVDFDHDGRVDLAHTNGWPAPEFDADPTRVFRNVTTPGWPVMFAQVAPACGISHTDQGRGMLNFDYDNDGDQDVVVFTNDGPLVLYRNDVAGANAHWLRVFLNTRATAGLAADGYGAHVVATANGVPHHAWLCGGSNYLSQSELSVHFGLAGSSVVDELRIEWGNGRVTVLPNVAADHTFVVNSCRADHNRDGLTGVQDLFDFLADYFAGQADFNFSGVTSLQDIFDFLAAWFGGCS